VIYNGYAEASMVGPAWHGWLHHTFELPPTEEKVVPRPWWKPHRPNLTGTPAAHRPTGSTLAQGRRPKATGDYRRGRRGADAHRRHCEACAAGRSNLEVVARDCFASLA